MFSKLPNTPEIIEIIEQKKTTTIKVDGDRKKSFCEMKEESGKDPNLSAFDRKNM